MGYPDSKEDGAVIIHQVSRELLHMSKWDDRFETWAARKGAQPLPLFNQLQFTCPISCLLKSLQ